MATTQQLIDYYANLLILQYRGKPKAYATIQAFVKMFIMDQIPTQVQDAFNLDSAVGVQLDVLGKYAGVSRKGFNFTGPVTLGDDDFRSLIKLAIVENYSGSSLSDIQNLLQIYFANALFVFDYQNMRMSYFLDSTAIGEQLAEFFIRQGSLPKPMGVQLAAVIYVPSIDGWFGMRTYDNAAYNVHGFNTYTTYDSNCHWLDYDDTI